FGRHRCSNGAVQAVTNGHHLRDQTVTCCPDLYRPVDIGYLIKAAKKIDGPGYIIGMDTSFEVSLTNDLHIRFRLQQLHPGLSVTEGYLQEVMVGLKVFFGAGAAIFLKAVSRIFLRLRPESFSTYISSNSGKGMDRKH